MSQDIVLASSFRVTFAASIMHSIYYKKYFRNDFKLATKRVWCLNYLLCFLFLPRDIWVNVKCTQFEEYKLYSELLLNQLKQYTAFRMER